MKKQKCVDEKEEEKLQLAEQTSHLKKRKTKEKSVSSSSSSSDISTWEDEKPSPRFDLMNNSPSAKKPIVVEKKSKLRLFPEAR